MAWGRLISAAFAALDADTCVGHVERHRQRPPVEAGDLGGEILELGQPPRRDGDLGPRPGQGQREMAAEARRCAGDHGDAAGEIEPIAGHAAPSRPLARSRSTNFWILPVEVLGNGPNTTVRGTLKWARLSRHQPMISAAVTGTAFGFKVTKAHGVSPHFSSGRATTAASITCGCL